MDKNISLEELERVMAEIEFELVRSTDQLGVFRKIKNDQNNIIKVLKTKIKVLNRLLGEVKRKIRRKKE